MATMATSEPLVPNDLPYGSRQEVEAGMQRAGMPKAPTGGPPNGARMFIEGTRPQARPARADFDPLLEASPDQFRFLGNRETAPQPAAQTRALSPSETFAQLAATSGSAFGRALAANLASRR